MALILTLTVTLIGGAPSPGECLQGGWGHPAGREGRDAGRARCIGQRDPGPKQGGGAGCIIRIGGGVQT